MVMILFIYLTITWVISLVQFGHSVVSDSLRPHWPQHASPPCPSPTPEVYTNSCPLSPWCHATISSLLSPSPPALNLSQHQGLFKWVSSSHQVAKVLSFSFNISPSNEHSGLISFRMDWLDLLAVQGTLRNFLQHHSSRASILQHLAFFIVQLSHPFMTIGKTIAVTRLTFVSKVLSLLFNMLSRLVITFLPRSKHLLKNKVSHCFLCFPNYLPWNDGTRCHDLRFFNVEEKLTVYFKNDKSI